MTAEEYFGDWMEVIDREELFKIMRWLSSVNKDTLCPSIKNVFKAFLLCPYKDLKVVMLGMDPYPQKGVAQGLLFANSKETSEDKVSPSLKIIKEAIIDYEIPHNTIIFDNSLEDWAKQGILLINSALTCMVGNTGCHFTIWNKFISKLLTNISRENKSIVYLLFGNQARSFSNNISSPYILSEYHPAYYARRNEKMRKDIFIEMNNIINKLYGNEIKLFKETEYGKC